LPTSALGLGLTPRASAAALLRYNYKDFSVGSWKAMVDIDAAELFKPTITVDLKIACDCKVGRVPRGVPREYPESTPRVPREYPESTPRVPREYPESTPRVPVEYP
jgi:acetolactate synthase-1/2/3 large subunit